MFASLVPLSLVALFLYYLPLTYGLSSADIVSVFGSTNQSLTGSAVQLPKFTLTIMTNDSKFYHDHPIASIGTKLIE